MEVLTMVRPEGQPDEGHCRILVRLAKVKQNVLSPKAVYSSCSMYLCLISFHCFYAMEMSEQRSWENREFLNTHSLIPTVPEGVGGNVQANSKGKRPSDNCAEEDA